MGVKGQFINIVIDNCSEMERALIKSDQCCSVIKPL